MNIIILAAGMGTRMKEKTVKIPKCLIEVNNEKIIDRQLKNIKQLKPNNVIIVTGYLSDLLENYISEKWGNILNLKFIESKEYKTTNNIFSLYLTKDYMKDDFMILESDVFFEKKIFNNIDFKNKNLWFTDKFTINSDGCMLTSDKNNNIKKIEIIRKKLSYYGNNIYKSIGILFIGKQKQKIIELLEYEINSGNKNIYFDLLFSKYINNINISIQNIFPKKWFEIDNQNDLEKAEQLFI